MTVITMIPAADLKPGQLVDLEGDEFAHDACYPVCLYEYGKVEDIEQETPECVRVDFENFDSIGFPTRHRLKVDLEGSLSDDR